MEIEEQKRTFSAFANWTKYSIIAITIFLILMAAFVA